MRNKQNMVIDLRGYWITYTIFSSSSPYFYMYPNKIFILAWRGGFGLLYALRVIIFFTHWRIHLFYGLPFSLYLHCFMQFLRSHACLLILSLIALYDSPKLTRGRRGRYIIIFLATIFTLPRPFQGLLLHEPYITPVGSHYLYQNLNYQDRVTKENMPDYCSVDRRWPPFLQTDANLITRRKMRSAKLGNYLNNSSTFTSS